jgi:hypothetical protein
MQFAVHDPTVAPMQKLPSLPTGRHPHLPEQSAPVVQGMAQVP